MLLWEGLLSLIPVSQVSLIPIPSLGQGAGPGPSTMLLIGYRKSNEADKRKTCKQNATFLWDTQDSSEKQKTSLRNRRLLWETKYFLPRYKLFLPKYRFVPPRYKLFLPKKTPFWVKKKWATKVPRFVQKGLGNVRIPSGSPGNLWLSLNNHFYIIRSTIISTIIYYPYYPCYPCTSLLDA